MKIWEDFSMFKIVLIFLIITTSLFSQEIIDISVKGISDSKNEGAQKDRMEAIMDAKRQACEKAGLHLKSKTIVENFITIFDYIESEAEAILLPGFQIIDIGYVADGTYQVVLSGKIKVVKEEKISAKELRYAKSLKDRGKWSQCKQILQKYIDSKNEEVSETLKEEALYLYIKWGFSFNVQENCEKYAAFYPESEKVSRIVAFGEFAKKPVFQYSKEYETDSTHWVDEEYKHKSMTFHHKIRVVSDTLIFKAFAKNEITLLIDLSLHRTDDRNAARPLAYYLKISYMDGHINKFSGEQDIKIVDENFKKFSKSGSKTFQRSSSGNWFKHFVLRHYQINGNVPFGQQPYKYKIEFDVYQNGF